MSKSVALALVLLGAVVPARAAGIFAADSQLNVSSLISVNNTTAVVISAAAATVYGIQISNNSATVAYLKLYNSASQTCGSGTPQFCLMIPASTTIPIENVGGDAYVNGVSVCLTTGIADSDTGAPAANAYIVDIHWKKSL